MDPLTYRIIHLVGLAALTLGLGGMLASGGILAGGNRKTFAIWNGVALLVLLISGFGLLAKLHLGFPHFAIMKVILWLVIGALPVLFRRLKLPLSAAIVIVLVLVGVMAWLGATKPLLW
jgi:hypothetical protein